MKVEVIGGSRYSPSVSAARFNLNNSELHILCKTATGPITIDLPKLSDFGIATNAKIFIEDVDSMSSINNITIIAASRVVPLGASVVGLREIASKVGLVIIGNRVEELKNSIGSSIVIAGFLGAINNNGTHIIDSVEAYVDAVSGSKTIIYSSSLQMIDEKGTPTVILNEIQALNNINGKSTYILSKNGAKVEIFASSEEGFAVLSDTLADDSYASKVYDALISQDKNNAPTEKTLNGDNSTPYENTINGVWAYESVGVYTYTKTLAFLNATKVKVVFYDNRANQGSDVFVSAKIRDANTIALSVNKAGVVSDSALSSQPITITVFSKESANYISALSSESRVAIVAGASN